MPEESTAINEITFLCEECERFFVFRKIFFNRTSVFFECLCIGCDRETTVQMPFTEFIRIHDMNQQENERLERTTLDPKDFDRQFLKQIRVSGDLTIPENPSS